MSFSIHLDRYSANILLTRLFSKEVSEKLLPKCPVIKKAKYVHNYIIKLNIQLGLIDGELKDGLYPTKKLATLAQKHIVMLIAHELGMQKLPLRYIDIEIVKN